MHKIIFSPTMQIVCLKGMERLMRHLSHAAAKRWMAKKKWKSQNHINSQTSSRVWIEGLLQMTLFAHSNDIYIANTKVFLVGPDFLIFGVFIAGMILIQM